MKSSSLRLYWPFVWFITGVVALGVFLAIGDDIISLLSIRLEISFALIRHGLIVLYVLIATILALVYHRSVLKRCNAIVDVIRRFEGGAHYERVHSKKNDEIRELEQTFDRMADGIVQTIEKLKTNDTLRRELIANVSHDLRTPITSIQGYLETLLLKEDSLGSAERKEYITIIRSNTQRLVTLVNDLFELSILDAQTYTVSMEPFSIEELLDQVVSSFKPKAGRKNISIDFRPARVSTRVHGDIALIERAVSNLLENAIYYTEQGGGVSITLSLENKRVSISIADTGIGIPEEDLPHLFERFYRVNKDRSKDTGGTGLGLAITRRIVDLHGGKIEIHSKLRQGTTVRFDLPVA